MPLQVTVSTRAPEVESGGQFWPGHIVEPYGALFLQLGNTFAGYRGAVINKQQIGNTGQFVLLLLVHMAGTFECQRRLFEHIRSLFDLVKAIPGRLVKYRPVDLREVLIIEQCLEL